MDYESRIKMNWIEMTVLQPKIVLKIANNFDSSTFGITGFEK